MPLPRRSPYSAGPGLLSATPPAYACIAPAYMPRPPRARCPSALRPQPKLHLLAQGVQEVSGAHPQHQPCPAAVPIYAVLFAALGAHCIESCACSIMGCCLTRAHAHVI